MYLWYRLKGPGSQRHISTQKFPDYLLGLCYFFIFALIQCILKNCSGNHLRVFVVYFVSNWLQCESNQFNMRTRYQITLYLLVSKWLVSKQLWIEMTLNWIHTTQLQCNMCIDHSAAGRQFTVSLALPGSILDNAQSPELRTYLAGQVRKIIC